MTYEERKISIKRAKILNEYADYDLEGKKMSCMVCILFV